MIFQSTCDYERVDGEKPKKPKCLSPFVFKSKNVNENNQGNDGGNSHQTVSINNNKHVANIDTNNGWNSWNSVWDYGNVSGKHAFLETP